MDIEELKRIKKGNPRMLEKLQKEYLPQSWFLCYHLTKDVETAAPLLISAWSKTLAKLMQAKNAPRENFLELLSTEIFATYRKGVTPNSDFSECTPPKVHASYRIFTDQYAKLDEKKRTPYLLYTFGNISTAKLAVLMHKSAGQTKELVQEASTEIMDYAKSIRKGKGTELITLSTRFRNSDGSGLNGVEVPDFVLASLEHTLSQELEVTLEAPSKETSIDKPAKSVRKSKPTTTKTSNRKETLTMSQRTVSQQRHSAKLRKRIIAIAVVCIIVAAGGFGIYRLALNNTVSAEIVTTYYAEAITYGDVDSTISGSGTLTPVTNEYLTAENPCEVDSLNVEVGDTVEEGDVIATITETITTQTIDQTTMEIEETTETEETEITAPCDGIVTELPVAEGDSLETGGEIAIILGTETGFTISLTVDELEIANVAIGQEATVTVDAVDGEYTGEVTNLSYNGTTSGNTVAYQLTVTIDYDEGIYSGMSAATEIIIESSGDGLLVPVDAVHTSGDDSYVYLAPSDAEEGTEYDEEELDLDDLTQVTVTTDMSDGSYIMIESDELEEGDLIIMSEVSTTATASDSDDTSSGFGGFGGGGNMGGGDMDFGDMDFSNMPQMGGQ